MRARPIGLTFHPPCAVANQLALPGRQSCLYNAVLAAVVILTPPRDIGIPQSPVSLPETGFISAPLFARAPITRWAGAEVHSPTAVRPVCHGRHRYARPQGPPGGFRDERARLATPCLDIPAPCVARLVMASPMCVTQAGIVPAYTPRSTWDSCRCPGWKVRLVGNMRLSRNNSAHIITVLEDTAGAK